MSKISAKAYYDKKVAVGLFWIGFLKYAGIGCIILGIILAVFLYSYWSAFIVGLLLLLIGGAAFFAARFLGAKVKSFAGVGGILVETCEDYVVDKAKEQINKMLNGDNKDQKS